MPHWFCSLNSLRKPAVPSTNCSFQRGDWILLTFPHTSRPSEVANNQWGHPQHMGVTGVSAGICAEAEIQSTNSLPEVSFEVRIMGEAVDETRFWFDLNPQRFFVDFVCFSSALDFPRQKEGPIADRLCGFFSFFFSPSIGDVKQTVVPKYHPRTPAQNTWLWLARAGRGSQVERQDLSHGQNCEPCDVESSTGCVAEGLQRWSWEAMECSSHCPRHAPSQQWEGQSGSSLGS